MDPLTVLDVGVDECRVLMTPDIDFVYKQEYAAEYCDGISVPESSNQSVKIASVLYRVGYLVSAAERVHGRLWIVQA